MSPELWGRSGRSSRRRPRKHTNLALIYTDYSAPSDRGPRKSRADRALAVDALRRGGDAVGFVPTDRMLLPPVDREGMRRKAGSAVEVHAVGPAHRSARHDLGAAPRARAEAIYIASVAVLMATGRRDDDEVILRLRSLSLASRVGFARPYKKIFALQDPCSC